MDNNHDDHTEAFLEGGDDMEHNHVTLMDIFNPEKGTTCLQITARGMYCLLLCVRSRLVIQLCTCLIFGFRANKLFY